MLSTTQEAPSAPSLSLMLLKLFRKDKFLPSRGIGTQEQFTDSNNVAISQHLQSLTKSGLLEIRGGRSAASYRLTPLGEMARDFQEQELVSS